MADDQPMKLREAAAYLRIKPRTLYGYVRDGKVPFDRVGRGLRFRKAALDAWMADPNEEVKLMQAKKHTSNMKAGAP